MNHEEKQQAETALTTVEPARGGLVRPIAGYSDIASAFQQYRELSEKILEDSDRIKIGRREFTKRSGWRKLATAYGVDLEVRPENVVVDRDEMGRILRATVYARATAPNGRFADGIGVSDRSERCCQGWPCTIKHREGTHCRADQFAVCLRSHFSNPEHDLVATASTRAMNRAAADLFGLGEVSAEEVTDEGHPPAPPPIASAELVAAIRELIPQTDLTEERICEGWGIGRLEELTEPRATASLQELRKRAGVEEPSEARAAADEPSASASTDQAAPAAIEHVDAIRALLWELSMDEMEICKVEKIDTLDAVTPTRATAILRRLEDIKAKRAKPVDDGQQALDRINELAADVTEKVGS